MVVSGLSHCLVEAGIMYANIDLTPGCAISNPAAANVPGKAMTDG